MQVLADRLNGATFDVPFLQTAFPRFKPLAHLDLRYPLRRLGLTGGLKEIERTAGIKRPRHLREVDGFDRAGRCKRAKLIHVRIAPHSLG